MFIRFLRTLIILAVSLILCAEVFAQTPAPTVVLRLEDLEQMALQSNPTLAQADAAVRASEGRRVQAGLYPNPIIGYSGDKLSTRAFNQRSEHSAFFEQEIPLGGKLSKSRNIFAQEKIQAEFDAASQKQRVLNAVRMLYYEALGAQQLVDVRTQLAKLIAEAVGVTGELFNVGQADRPDVLAIEIEARRAKLDLVMAENVRDQIWQQLAVVIGNPFLKSARLAGEIEKNLPQLNQEEILTQLLRESPEVKKAQAGIERARASLTRAKAEPTPDLYVRGGWGYNNETLDLRNQNIAKPPTAAGAQGFAEIGIRIPIFNRNQGGIAVSTAELDSAEREAQRVELMLRAQTAMAFRSYQNALAAATEYQQEIVPRAQQAYDLYLVRFKQMAAAYPQVLIAQRTLIQVRADYIHALVDVWQNATRLRGFLLEGALDAPSNQYRDR
jgi:outer membrane protein, heavy metal efflux system